MSEQNTPNLYRNDRKEEFAEKASIEKESGFEHPIFNENMVAVLDGKIRHAIGDFFKHEIKEMMLGEDFSVEHQRQFTILRVRYEVLMALRFPFIQVETSPGVTDRLVAGSIIVANQLRETGKYENRIRPFTGQVFAENIHDFPIIWRVAGKVCKEMAVQFPALLEWAKGQEQMMHELEHLIPILNSEQQAIPIIGVQISILKRPNEMVWIYNPLATFEGTLSQQEYIEHTQAPSNLSSGDKERLEKLSELD